MVLMTSFHPWLAISSSFLTSFGGGSNESAGRSATQNPDFCRLPDLRPSLDGRALPGSSLGHLHEVLRRPHGGQRRREAREGKEGDRACHEGQGHQRGQRFLQPETE